MTGIQERRYRIDGFRKMDGKRLFRGVIRYGQPHAERKARGLSDQSITTSYRAVRI